MSSILLNSLIIGDGKDAKNAHFLQSKGVTLIVNCAEEIPNHYPNLFRYVRLNMRDSLDQELMTTITPAVNLIIKTIKEGGVVFVHCAAGISRSGSVVVNVIMKLHGWDYDRSLKFVKMFRLIVNPNENFENALRNQGGVSNEFEYIQNNQHIQNNNRNKQVFMKNNQNDKKNGNFSNETQSYGRDIEIYGGNMTHGDTYVQDNYTDMDYQQQNQQNIPQQHNEQNYQQQHNEHNISQNYPPQHSEPGMLMTDNRNTLSTSSGKYRTLDPGANEHNEFSKQRGPWSQLTFDSDISSRPQYAAGKNGSYAMIFS